MEIAGSLLGIDSMCQFYLLQTFQFMQKLQEMIIFLYYIALGKV